jgi:toxin secretion/phage lysis holin
MRFNDAEQVLTVPVLVKFVGGLAIALAGFWIERSLVQQALVYSMGADMVMGFLAGLNTQKLSSAAWRRSAVVKIATLLIVAAVFWLQAPSGMAFLQDACALFFLGVEWLSLLENASLAGVPIPPIIRVALTKVQELAQFGKSEEDSAGDGK